jgi:hypothetical protein
MPKLKIVALLAVPLSQFLKPDEVELLANSSEMTWGTNAHSLVSWGVLSNAVARHIEPQSRTHEIIRALGALPRGVFIDLER